MKRFHMTPSVWMALIICALFIAGSMMAQLNQSGGPGSSVTATQGPSGASAWKVDGSGVTQPISGTVSVNALPPGSNVIGHVITDSGTVNVGTITSITNALPAGTNLLGFIMSLPAGCSGSGSSLVVHNTVGIATGAGTSVSSVTGCIVEGFVNNITNSAVTFRLADKTGTPIIWLGGNADFTVPANSNMGFGGNNGINLSGVIMASGITAIAGTSSALNLHLVTRE
jgi:hypothetical protein